MKRRNFIRNSSLVSAGLLSVNSNFSNYNELKSKHNFNLQYAPHLGMFKNHALGKVRRKSKKSKIHFQI